MEGDYMMKTIPSLMFAAALALVGCGDDGDGSGGGGGGGSAGCQGWCEWTDECFGDSTGGGSVSDCVNGCDYAIQQESSACRAAWDDWGSCLAAQTSCDFFVCQDEAEAVGEHCDDSPM
jgi:hypothetical protein